MKIFFSRRRREESREIGNNRGPTIGGFKGCISGQLPIRLLSRSLGRCRCPKNWLLEDKGSRGGAKKASAAAAAREAGEEDRGRRRERPECCIEKHIGRRPDVWGENAVFGVCFTGTRACVRAPRANSPALTADSAIRNFFFSSLYISNRRETRKRAGKHIGEKHGDLNQ